MGPETTARPVTCHRHARTAALIAACLATAAGLTALTGPSVRVEPGGRGVRFAASPVAFLPSLGVAYRRNADGTRSIDVDFHLGTGR